MKNKLLGALLIFTAIPFFANKATAQQSTVKLLTHLKQVKGDLELDLANTSTIMSNLSEDDKELKDAVTELYNLIAPSLSKGIDKIVSMICTQKKSLQEMIIDNSIQNAYDEGTGFEQLLADDFIENHQQEIEAILTKYSKILSKYNKNNAEPQENNISTLKKRIINCLSDSYTLGFIRVISEIEAQKNLLQKIDAKIAELACPSKPSAK